MIVQNRRTRYALESDTFIKEYRMKHIGTLIFSLLMGPGVAMATLLTYEGFDYTPSASIDGQTGGTGWRSPSNPSWTVASGSGTITSGGLSYADAGYTGGAPSESGNALSSSGASSRIQRIPDVDSGGVWDNAGLRNASGNVIGGSGVTGTFYGSMLVSSSDWSSSRLIYEFQNTGGGVRPRMDVNGSFQLTNTSGGPLSNPPAVTPTGSNTYLIVFQFDLDGTDTATESTDNNSNITYWINPVAGGTAPTGGTQMFTTQRKLIEFNQLDVRNIGTGDVTVDEIRFGTEWSDVAPIPEPGTLALMGVFSLALAAARHFRR